MIKILLDGMVSPVLIGELPVTGQYQEGSPSIPPGTNDIVALGVVAFGNQPAITTAVNVKSLQFGSAQAVTLTLSGGGSLTTSGNIDGVWTANANHTIAVGDRPLTVGGDLILSDGTSNHTIGLAISTGTVTVTGSLTESGGANITFSGAGNLNIAKDFNYTSGTFTPSTSTVKYNGTSSQTVAGLTYYNLTIDKTAGTASTSSAVTVGGALTLSIKRDSFTWRIIGCDRGCYYQYRYDFTSKQFSN